MPDLTIHPYRLTWQSPQTSDPRLGPSEPSTSRASTHKGKGKLSVTYTFSPVSSASGNIMSLVPSEGSAEATYFISTTMNVFMPLSYITTVYKGEGNGADKIGEFEMGISTTPASVEIQNSRTWLKSVLSRTHGGRTDGVWHWSPPNAPDKNLEWDYNTAPLAARCFSRREHRTLLATYKYPNHIVPVPSRTHALELTFDGQAYFDHIVLSLLIIERKRLTPKRSMLSKLWNFDL